MDFVRNPPFFSFLSRGLRRQATSRPPVLVPEAPKLSRCASSAAFRPLKPRFLMVFSMSHVVSSWFLFDFPCVSIQDSISTA